MAERYRRAIIREFAPSLRGTVVEIGAGIGQNTPLLLESPGVKQVVSVEPEPAFCAEFRRQYPGLPLIEGTSASLPAAARYHAIVSINVLEHIQEDSQELARYRSLLAAERGRLCLFVPARQEIYAPLDHDFGHFRRYERVELRAKLKAAGFEVLRLSYFNLIGYFAWWIGFCLLKKRAFNPAAVRFYDRFVFPATRALERLMAPPIGQSLIAVAQVS